MVLRVTRLSSPLSRMPKAPESLSPPLSLTLIRLLSVNRLSRIVLREAAGVTETPATLRSASTPDSTLCLPLISNPAHGQPEARRPLMCQWSPSTTTQEAVRPLILGSAPLPYALTVIGEAAVPRALSVSGPRKEPPRLTATVSP